MSEKSRTDPIVIAYRGFAAGQGYEMWREQICRGFVRLDVEPSKGSRIDCRIQIAALSDLALGTATGMSGQFARTPDLLSDGCDDFVLVCATGGPLHLTQSGKSIALERSQMCLTDMSVKGIIGLGASRQMTTLRIPRRALLSINPKAEQKLSEPLPGDTALPVMIARYQGLAAELASGLDAVAQRLTAQHLVDLIALHLGSEGDERELARQRGYAAAQFELIKSDILAKLDQTELTIDAVAQLCGSSRRHVQRLFRAAGTTFTDFVVDQRLLLARRLLGQAQYRNSKISAIANAAGFSDLSYFNRIFRKRFGVTPTEMRAGLP